jgi:hypothetical protein
LPWGWQESDREFLIGWVNFLDDSSQKLHMKLTAIDKAFGVTESTGQGKAKAIRDLLRIRQLDFHWMLRKQVEENPVGWMIQVNGFVLDARHLRLEIQEDAFHKGLIPYIPGDQPSNNKAGDESGRTDLGESEVAEDRQRWVTGFWQTLRPAGPAAGSASEASPVCRLEQGVEKPPRLGPKHRHGLWRGGRRQQV